MKINKILAIFISLFTLSALATDFPDENSLFFYMQIDSDSMIKGPPYSDIVNELKNLEKTYPESAKVFFYGRTLGGKSLALIKIAKVVVKPVIKEAIYIGGSIHGDEYLNLEDRLPRWFLEQSAD